MGSPFAFCILLALFWILYKFYSKQSFFVMVENFFITTSITFFFFQSSIINALADLLNCTQIENDYYLDSYLIEKCADETNYHRWRNFMILPAFGFFALILTTLPFIYMFRNKNILYTQDVLRKVGFLLNGYSKQYFYW